MFQRAVLAIAISVSAITEVSACIVVQPTGSFQVTYGSNLNTGDSVINITNSNASGGTICANVYAFSPDEQLVSCCACSVTPNALVSLSARRDLISNTLTPGVPTSMVVKLLATTSPAGGCNAASPTVATLAGGLNAWATHLHNAPPGLTEDAAQVALLSAAELAKVTSLCGFIQSNGSGFGICNSCRLGGLAGVKQ